MKMATEAIYRYGSQHERERHVTASAAYESGQVIQLEDGKMGVVLGLNPDGSGEEIAVATSGVFECARTASMVMLEGGKAFWDTTNNKVTCLHTAGPFLGTVMKDSASSDTTVLVDLNAEPSWHIELGKTPFALSNTAGGSSAIEGNMVTLAATAVAEVQMAAALSHDSVPVAAGFIASYDLAVYDIGDNAAVDVNIGVANDTHATDADSITESVFIHLDGTALSILAESDDGTTEVAATDTTVDAVDDTFFHVDIDARDVEDIQIYINGVNVLPASVFALDEATGPIKFLAHFEKSSNDTTADFRVRHAGIRKPQAA
jgi:predicted RecA/RadA family phage recombinase